MWNGIQDRKHTVTKVFPARFQEEKSEGPAEHEVMLFGEVHRTGTDGSEVRMPWAGHAVVRKEKEGEREEWRFAHYQVWLQV